MRFVVRVAFVLIVASAVSALATVPAQAQGTPELAIRGVVVDAMHAAIVGARVAASSPSQPPASTVTDQVGAFTLHVPSGQYDLLITADGFAVLQQTVAAASVTAKPTEFMLQVPGVRES